MKPTFHAYRLLNTLGDELLAHNAAGVVTRSWTTGKLSVLAYHYPPEVKQTVHASFDSREVAERTLATGQPADFVLKLSGLPSGPALVIETVDTTHGDALFAWKVLGSPEPLSRAHPRTSSRPRTPRAWKT